MEKKYKLTNETINIDGTTLYRIEALKDFSDVKKGDKGGFVESEINLSHDGDCWIYNDAKVLFSIQVIGPWHAPFKSAEECLKEMSKHSPTGWVKYKDVDCSCNITSIYGGEINEIILSNIHHISFEEAFEKLSFVDGEPFGIKTPSPWDKRIPIY